MSEGEFSDRCAAGDIQHIMIIFETVCDDIGQRHFRTADAAVGRSVVNAHRLVVGQQRVAGENHIGHPPGTLVGSFRKERAVAVIGFGSDGDLFEVLEIAGPDDSPPGAEPVAATAIHDDEFAVDFGDAGGIAAVFLPAVGAGRPVDRFGVEMEMDAVSASGNPENDVALAMEDIGQQQVAAAKFDRAGIQQKITGRVRKSGGSENGIFRAALKLEKYARRIL